MVYSGMGPDYRVLVDRARKVSHTAYKRIYNEYPPTRILVQDVARVMQEATQSGGVRPYGVSLLVAGWDEGILPEGEEEEAAAAAQEGEEEKKKVGGKTGGILKGGPMLYQVDPSGSYFPWKATAIGKSATTAKTFLEKRYTEGLELEDAVHIALLTLKETIEGEMNGETIEIGEFLFIGHQHNPVLTLLPLRRHRRPPGRPPPRRRGRRGRRRSPLPEAHAAGDRGLPHESVISGHGVLTGWMNGTVGRMTGSVLGGTFDCTLDDDQEHETLDRERAPPPGMSIPSLHDQKRALPPGRNTHNPLPLTKHPLHLNPHPPLHGPCLRPQTQLPPSIIPRAIHLPVARQHKHVCVAHRHVSNVLLVVKHHRRRRVSELLAAREAEGAPARVAPDVEVVACGEACKEVGGCGKLCYGACGQIGEVCHEAGEFGGAVIGGFPA